MWKDRDNRKKKGVSKMRGERVLMCLHTWWRTVYSWSLHSSSPPPPLPTLTDRRPFFSFLHFKVFTLLTVCARPCATVLMYEGSLAPSLFFVVVLQHYIFFFCISFVFRPYPTSTLHAREPARVRVCVKVCVLMPRTFLKASDASTVNSTCFTSVSTPECLSHLASRLSLSVTCMRGLSGSGVRGER